MLTIFHQLRCMVIGQILTHLRDQVAFQSLLHSGNDLLLLEVISVEAIRIVHRIV